MSETTNGLTPETLKRMRIYRIKVDGVGGEAKVNGIAHGAARVVAMNDEHLVVAFSGHGENPGSRYSGLHAYYPAETVTYKIVGYGGFDLIEVEELIRWRTRAKK